MPRQNRYHPYSRQQMQPQCAPPLPSPRYPSPPSLTLPRTPAMPPISENHNPHYEPNQLQNIYPQYIRGAVTSDGKTLITKTIHRDPDGVFHITMEPVRFPSECRPGQIEDLVHGELQHEGWGVEQILQRRAGTPASSASSASFASPCASQSEGEGGSVGLGLGMVDEREVDMEGFKHRREPEIGDERVYLRTIMRNRGAVLGFVREC